MERQKNECTSKHIMSVKNYFYNYESWRNSTHSKLLSYGTPVDNPGLVSNACGQAAQRGCTSVYQNDGAQRPIGQSRKKRSQKRKASTEAPRPRGDNIGMLIFHIMNWFYDTTKYILRFYDILQTFYSKNFTIIDGHTVRRQAIIWTNAGILLTGP